MIKKIISLVILICFVSPMLFSSTAAPFPEYSPYLKEEFPSWAHKLRRAESLFFGSLVISVPLSLGINGYINSVSPVSLPSNDPNLILRQIGLSVSISLMIVLIDYIIGEVSG